MEYDFDRVDEVALALLALTHFTHHGQTRAWKAIDFEVMDRLYEKGFIEDPRNKNRSVVMTDDGVKRSLELFDRLLANKS